MWHIGSISVYGAPVPVELGPERIEKLRKLVENAEADLKKLRKFVGLEDKDTETTAGKLSWD